MFEDVFRINYKVVKKELVVDGEIQNDINLDLSELISDIGEYIRKDHVKIKTIKIRGWDTPKGYTLDMSIKATKIIATFFDIIKYYGFDMIYFNIQDGFVFTKSVSDNKGGLI